MKKVLAILAASVIMAGCSSLKPAENVQALREVNSAKVNLAVAEDLKVKADKRAECARQRVVHAEAKLEAAYDKFESVYEQSK